MISVILAQKCEPKCNYGNVMWSTSNHILCLKKKPPTWRCHYSIDIYYLHNIVIKFTCTFANIWPPDWINVTIRLQILDGYKYYFQLKSALVRSVWSKFGKTKKIIFKYCYCSKFKVKYLRQILQIDINIKLCISPFPLFH